MSLVTQHLTVSHKFPVPHWLAALLTYAHRSELAKRLKVVASWRHDYQLLDDITSNLSRVGTTDWDRLVADGNGCGLERCKSESLCCVRGKVKNDLGLAWPKPNIPRVIIVVSSSRKWFYIRGQLKVHYNVSVVVIHTYKQQRCCRAHGVWIHHDLLIEVDQE